MNQGQRFDELTRALATTQLSRWQVLKVLLAGATVGTFPFFWAGHAGAKPKCLGGGETCQNPGNVDPNCCSGECLDFGAPGTCSSPKNKNCLPGGAPCKGNGLDRKCCSGVCDDTGGTPRCVADCPIGQCLSRAGNRGPDDCEVGCLSCQKCVNGKCIDDCGSDCQGCRRPCRTIPSLEACCTNICVACAETPASGAVGVAAQQDVLECGVCETCDEEQGCIPAPDGTKCGTGPCENCEGGACVPIPETTPCGETCCGSCQVCDDFTTGTCRNCDSSPPKCEICEGGKCDVMTCPEPKVFNTTNCQCVCPPPPPPPPPPGPGEACISSPECLCGTRIIPTFPPAPQNIYCDPARGFKCCGTATTAYCCKTHEKCNPAGGCFPC
jgi:hypothetical protein